MGRSIYKLSKIRQEAEELNFTILINNCCREFNNNTYYSGIPKYDEVLSEYFGKTGHDLHLKLDFLSETTEVYVPLRYVSESKRHLYHFPVVARNLETEELKEIDIDRFLELVVSHARFEYPNASVDSIKDRLHNSIDNIEAYLKHFQETKKEVNKAEMSFIESEQLLAVGHSTHPLTKGRSGFSNEDLINYSPETGGRFQLHYFLIHHNHVTEESVEEKLFSEILKDELRKYAIEDESVIQLLKENPQWKVVPVHPWEANYLLVQPDVKDMQSNKLLYDLGAWGALYTPTSSVRTVYNEESDWMFKFSLHVKITSAERVNYLHELYRGYDFSRLLKTPWGENLKNEYPDITIISDPGFISVSYKGKVIDGFNTSIRYNPFKGRNADKNIAVLASICQDEILGEPARIVNIIEEAAKRKSLPVEETAIAWFQKYIALILPATINLFNKHGVACELHQQNVLVEFDEALFPSRIYFRDNQGFLFRKSKEEELISIVPDLAKHSKAFIPDDRLFSLLSHYFIISNITSLINVFGCNGLTTENQLIDIVYTEINKAKDTSGFVDYVLNNRYWKVKGNLLTALTNIDGGAAPSSVVQVDYPNILHNHFLSKQLIFPAGKETIYSRYFPKADVTISIRPMDLDRDLEMLHEWFHRDHAKKIWQMDWPIRELEVYYRTMIAGNVLCSYIGEANGEPTCNFEVYWTTRDQVGDYYDVLPTDYGTHQFIAPTDPKKKFVSPFTQCMVDYVFAQPEVGKMVGEGAVNSLASMMNKTHVGFKIEKVIEMPHKKANLNFCYREWYWAKFPQNKNIVISPISKETSENLI
ncbi:GNAT family N-acetyltransferase [Flavivirga jejuensis]|uniref:GNAT family N-acetyltransferase n=1 Tax=Flavivirga jejuensis TaxID=870487 RepID=A0ABT8WLZ5_9FLAO|nr:GNAT family N-acetyltransferase [Flavivirga jejuensis]MDO5974019.1 GNAT family N-acetyltransferase [Flavivirga jejuensis]